MPDESLDADLMLVAEVVEALQQARHLCRSLGVPMPTLALSVPRTSFERLRMGVGLLTDPSARVNALFGVPFVIEEGR